jgi:Na+-translocating ferredoxin:NAD+ oxidoreductase RnfG subunit
MKKIIIILIFINLIIGSEIKDKTINTINQFYQQEIKINKFKYSISKKIKKEIQSLTKQKFYRDQIFYWTIKINDELHYALMDNTIGKTMPITFLVIFNEKQEVIHSKIIKYREGYGGEISGKKWLSQFNGMRNDSLYKHGKEIDGISGATLSVKSFTKGISKLSLLLPYIMNK